MWMTTVKDETLTTLKETCFSKKPKEVFTGIIRVRSQINEIQTKSVEFFIAFQEIVSQQFRSLQSFQINI